MNSYTSDTNAREFVHFIAESQREELICILKEAKFFSLLLDGSTDTANYENELLLVVWFDCKGANEMVRTHSSYFKVCRPSAVTAQGLFQMLQEVLQSVLGIQEMDEKECAKLVGIGTDGASVNIARRGLKGLLEPKLPWLFWMWCIAHRLELAVKDALQDTTFKLIDDMLLKLYSLYQRSPKKCQQLDEIIIDLKECFGCDEGGTRPVKANGTRWIGHKWRALKRILAKYGAYTTHLASLSEDALVPAADRSKLQGYYKKWTDGKYVLGCAVFIDLLGPCVILSKVMQQDDLDILEALTGVLKSTKEVERLSTTPLDEWSTYSTTMKKCTTDTNGKVSYQTQEMKAFGEAKAHYGKHSQEYCSCITQCIKSRMGWSDIQLLRDIIFLLATNGWQKIIDEGDKLEATDRLAEVFAIPLQAADCQLEEIHAKFEDVLQYATQYISLATLSYRAVWWRIFNSPSASNWTNVLALVSLLFSLPTSNGKVEKIFSQVTNIKTNKRTRLSIESLDDLLMISSNNVPLKEFCPDQAIDKWWRDKVRRPNSAKPRKKRPRLETQDQELSDSESEDLLDEWDDLFDDMDSDL